MSNDLHWPLQFPENITNATIAEIMCRPHTELTINEREIVLYQRTDDAYLTIKYKKRARPDAQGIDPRSIYWDVVELYKQGLAQKDIASELGISRSYVCSVVKKYTRQKEEPL